MFVARPKKLAGQTREIVRQGRENGLNYAEIARAHGVAKSTVAYHARRLGEPADERCNRRYDWVEVQGFYDDGHSINACLRHFGMARKSLTDACRRGALVTRPQAQPLEMLLATSTRNRAHLLRRLVTAGLKPPRCELCGIAEWLGLPLTLQLHHRNGSGLDNRLDNLQVLCPNCHSQTDTWSGRNKRPQTASAS